MTTQLYYEVTRNDGGDDYVIHVTPFAEGVRCDTCFNELTADRGAVRSVLDSDGTETWICAADFVKDTGLESLKRISYEQFEAFRQWTSPDAIITEQIKRGEYEELQ